MPSMADLQRAPGAAASVTPASLPLAIERVRTFDTPEFRGMTFLEVEAKTALNRVKGMGFPWSINPYRGCSHACSYCLGGETAILMADGRTRPLAHVRPGDQVYGTVRRGAYRRYVHTPVLDHWSTVKPAYRVRLEDGTQLLTSADHRFLTERGWKHVTDAPHGPRQRAHLTTNNTLAGTGGFAPPPKHGAEYRRGYLCGMIRGDGHVGSPVDDEARHRTRSFLQWEGVEAVRELVAWPARPPESWCKGFLAGIFDAEGGHSGSILRITNSDDVIIDVITACLRRFGFDFAVELRPNGCKVVRLRGGLREHLRFFHTTDPATTRKRSIAGRAVKHDASTRVVAVEPLGIDLPMYDITTGTGDFVAEGVVSHNCFARPTHAYLNLSPLGDFERTVVVKTNVVEVLRRELAKRSWKGEHVAMGTNTDPYQRCEGRYRLMPGIIEALGASRTPFSVLTKGVLITRDLDVLTTAARDVPVSAAFTVGMLDADLWRRSEPGTPSPAARLAAVEELADAGIPTGVMLAPIMPGLNDDREQLAALVDRAVRAGAAHVTPIVLHLRPGVREVFWPWLEAEHPELVPRYQALYGMQGRRGGQAAATYRDQVLAFVRARRDEAWRRYGRPTVLPGWRGSAGAGQDREVPAARAPAQQSLLDGLA